jgi:DNA polymerase-1
MVRYDYSRLDGLTAVAFDCETIPFVQGNPVPPLVGTGFLQKSLGGGCFITDDIRPRLFSGDDGVREFLRYLNRDDVLFVGHNIPYDFAVMLNESARLGHDLTALFQRVFEVYASGRVCDTSVQERLALVRLGKLKVRQNNLAATVSRLFGKQAAEPLKRSKKSDEAIRLRYGELYGVPLSSWPCEFREYLSDDVNWTMQVFLAQRSEPGGLSPDIHEMSSAAWALRLMSVWGTRTDGTRVAKVKAELEREYEKHLVLPMQAGLIRPDGTKNMKAIRERVVNAYTSQDLPIPQTKKKQVSTNSQALRKSQDPVLVALGKAAKPKTLLQTFIPVLEQGAEAPLNPFFQTTVESGRTSCSAPNVQNISRDGGIRECFIPRPGWAFVAADYDTLELRTLTQVVEDWFGPSRMGDALRAGLDLHLLFAAEQLLGITYEDAQRRQAEGDPDVSEARSFAKVANFGFPGGLGPASMASYAEGYGLGISEIRARTLRELWYAQWPEMRLYFRRIRELSADTSRSDGKVTFDDGRTANTFWVEQHLVGRRRGGCLYTSACNTFFQGLAADGAKRALFLVSHECYCVPTSVLFGCRPVLFVHDEVVMEVPPHVNLTEAADRLSAVMVAGMKSLVTRVPITAGPLAMTRWSKKAKEIRDPSGQLLAWQET